MTHTSTEQPELLPCPFCGSQMVSQSIGHTGEGNPFPYIECEECAASADPAFWNRRTPASQAQRVPLSEHAQALDFLAGLHPGVTIDGPPMAVAELIFGAVQADQRALKEEIKKKERNLDWMRKELAKRPSGITQEKRG